MPIVSPSPPPFSQAAPLPKLTPEYISSAYPKDLELIQAQVFFRHGERTPVKKKLIRSDSPWPFCQRANFLHAEFMKAVGRFVPRQETMPVPNPDRMAQSQDQRKQSDDHSMYTDKTATLKCGIEYVPAKWSVRLGKSPLDTSVSTAVDHNGNWDPKNCEMGQLSDIGLDTLYRTGQFLRSLYVDKLGFIPAAPTGATGPGSGSSSGSHGTGKLHDWLYIRTTDYSRVIQSTHALLVGLYPGYPKSAWDGDWTAFNKDFLQLFPIHTRLHKDETMHGNFGCYNFIRHFIDVDVKQANELKWILDIYRQTIQLPDGLGKRAQEMMDKPYFGSNFHPIYDELVSMKAHGQGLPNGVTMDFLNSLGIASHHQWTERATLLSGQRLGFGRLVDNVVRTLTQAAQLSREQVDDPVIRPRIGEQSKGDLRLAPGAIRPPSTPDETPGVPKLALYGAHDITVAPLAIIMGATNREWLPFASMLTFELFKSKNGGTLQNAAVEGTTKAADRSGLDSKAAKAPPSPRPISVPDSLDPAGYYVRVRLNDQILQVPTCEPPGKHHEGVGSSMCTLAAFFEHVAPLVPSEADYKAECGTMPGAFD
ncbi:hypothetical protein GGI07_005415 [Coemansia sp. Benny D115]|nr:hypothetical protein GGI07_005415 [Coemansia sp. Benny D115]